MSSGESSLSGQGRKVAVDAPSDSHSTTRHILEDKREMVEYQTSKPEVMAELHACALLPPRHYEGSDGSRLVGQGECGLDSALVFIALPSRSGLTIELILGTTRAERKQTDRVPRGRRDQSDRPVELTRPNKRERPTRPRSLCQTHLVRLTVDLPKDRLLVGGRAQNRRSAGFASFRATSTSESRRVRGGRPARADAS